MIFEAYLGTLFAIWTMLIITYFVQANRFKIVNVGSCNISIADREFNEYFKEFKEN